MARWEYWLMYVDLNYDDYSFLIIDVDLNYDDHSFLPNGHQAVWSPANDKPKDKHWNIVNRFYQYFININAT